MKWRIRERPGLDRSGGPARDVKRPRCAPTCPKPAGAKAALAGGEWFFFFFSFNDLAATPRSGKLIVSFASPAAGKLEIERPFSRRSAGEPGRVGGRPFSPRRTGGTGGKNLLPLPRGKPSARRGRHSTYRRRLAAEEGPGLFSVMVDPR